MFGILLWLCERVWVLFFVFYFDSPFHPPSPIDPRNTVQELKSHSSHDVLLLCQSCHLQMNAANDRFKAELSAKV